MLTKTQIRIMEEFVSRLDERFSIKQVSETIKKPYPLVHRSIKSLVDDRFLSKDKQKFLSLNYKENLPELAYIESSRTRHFLTGNKIVSLLIKDILDKISTDFFMLLVFGSFAENKRQPADLDLLVVIEDKNKVSKIEKIIYNAASSFTLKSHIHVISTESAYEMLSKRDKVNIMNETLNKHIIIFGAENYYRVLKNAR